MSMWAVAFLLNVQEPPYGDDPGVVERLAALESRTGALLPAVRVEAGGLTLHGVDRYGPGQRDYCNKMAYAPERRTALYAGGNHQVPHRMNDVWEYHLGSNAWHLLYAPDGGDPSPHKAAYFLTSRTLVKEPGKALSEKERGQIEAYRAWWNANVVLRDGHIATTRGGPIMPAHTWDAFCYDARAKRLIWGTGANGAAQVATLAYFSGKPVAELEAQLDASYTPLWIFDPAEKRWIHYRTPKPRARLEGMGATMAHLPELGVNLWYVAAQNVSPAAFEMWRFDARADAWTELKPNGGMSIAALATKEKVSPMAEAQTAYSPKHRILVAVLGPDTFVYEVEKDRWSKAAADERIHGHDARSVFAYDSRADVFLLAFPPGGKGKELKLAAFSPAERTWEILEPGGGLIPPVKSGGYMGYYDPRHNVLVLQGRSQDRLWVYRHLK